MPEPREGSEDREDRWTAETLRDDLPSSGGRSPGSEGRSPASEGRSSEGRSSEGRRSKSRGRAAKRPRGEGSDQGGRTRARSTGARERHSGARRHPDIEVARLLVKRGYLQREDAVRALKVQKVRAKEGRKRVPFLQVLVKQRLLEARRLPEVQDEIRRHTYLCDQCQARAVILGGSQSRAAACPRCGAPIFVDPPTDPNLVPRVSDFVRPRSEPESEGRMSGTLTWRPMGNRAMRAFAPGQVVFDRYLLREELGRGAMGIVYRAKHLELDKDVAIKVLVPNEEDWEQQVARFRREAAAVQRLRHEGIVQVQDFGSDGEVYYLTMDLVEGGESLHRRLKRSEDPPPLRWRLEVLEQVARAVDHAHQKGVVHRDLKPANVLLDPTGRPLVADFGLAKDEESEQGELTRTQDRLGTPLFMAPEQIRLGAATVDGRADVWALGVILFVALSGRYPFRSRTVLDLYSRILAEDPDWDGTRYSSPERQAPLHDSSSGRGSGGVASTRGAGEDPDPSEQTEAGPRTPSGKLPQTLAAPPELAIVVAPPPFVPPPELAGRAVPAELKAIVHCALAKDPEDRYPTAAALADDIQRYLAGEPIKGGGPSAAKRVKQALDKKRVLRPLAAGLALVAGLSLTGGAFALWRWSQTEQERLAEQRRREATDARAKLDERADAAWDRAVAAGSKEAYAQAKRDLDQLLEEVPDLARALRRRGEVELQLLEPEAGRKDLAAAVARSAGAPPVERVELRAAEARAALLAGDPAAAATAARAGLKAAEEAGSAAAPSLGDQLLIHLALAACEGRDPAAQQEAERRIAARRAQGDAQLPPDLIGLHARLALVRGDLTAARQRLSGVEPASASLETALALAHLGQAEGHPDKKAFDGLRDAFRKRAREEVARLNAMVGPLLSKNDYATLARVNQLTARLTPWYGELQWYLANHLLNRERRPDEALEHLRRAASLDPFDGASRDFYLSGLLARPDLGARLDEAARCFTREAAADPRSPRPLLRRAYVELRRGRLLEAWRSLAAADARCAGERPTGPARAAALRLATDTDRAALAQEPGWRDADPQALEREYSERDPFARCDDALSLARLYLEAGRVEEAARWIDAADPRGLPERGSAQFRRKGLRQSEWGVLAARLLVRRGRQDEALRLLERLRQDKDTWAFSVFPAALRACPELARLGSDPRFKELLEGQ
ncbi:MAG: protein kinase [Planctomycetota bacterium]